MRLVAPLLAVKVDGRIARIVRWHIVDLVFSLKALLARPRVDQRPIYTEVLIGKQIFAARLIQTSLKKRLATSALISRSRFLLYTVGTQTASSMFRPTNQRNSRLYCSCSISIRSLRSEYSNCSRSALSSFSGAIEGRPNAAYMSSNNGESAFSALSTIFRIGRSGWSDGTRSSGDK